MSTRRRGPRSFFIVAWHDHRSLKTSARNLAAMLRLFREDYPGEDLFWIYDRWAWKFSFLRAGTIHLVLQGPSQRISIVRSPGERPGSTSAFLAIHPTGETRIVTAATLCDAFQVVRAKTKEPIGLLLNLTGIDHGPDTFAGTWTASVESWEAGE